MPRFSPPPAMPDTPAPAPAPKPAAKNGKAVGKAVASDPRVKPIRQVETNRVKVAFSPPAAASADD